MATIDFTYGHRQRATESAIKLALEQGEMGIAADTKTVWIRDYDDFYYPLLPTSDVRSFGVIGDGATDDLAALQAAHDALPSTGGVIAVYSGTIMITGSARYVNITKDNVRIVFAKGAMLVSENSDDEEATTGGDFNVGFAITGNNCRVDGVTIRGGLITWAPSNEKHRLTVKDSRFFNLHNAGIAVANAANYSQLVVDNCDFDVSLATSTGNYTAIQRGDSADSNPVCGSVVVSKSRFRGVAGGVNMHRTSKVVLDDCRFEGVHINNFKVSRAVAGLGGQNGDQDVVVDGCYFDGAAINTASANRHLSCSDNSTPDYSDYCGFIQVFNSVQIKGNTFKNFGRKTLEFLDGSLLNANIVIEGNHFDTCPDAIFNPQGNVRIAWNTFQTANVKINSTNGTRSREIKIESNRFTDSKVYIGATAYAALQNRIRLYRNQIEYTLDNTGAVEIAEISGTTHTPLIFLDENYISVSGGGGANVKGVALSGSTLPTCAFRKGNVLVGSTTIDAGVNEYQHQVYDRTAGAGTYTIDDTPEVNGVPFDDWLLTNTNATADHTYSFTDSAYKVGTRLKVVRTNASYKFSLVIAGGGTIDGASSVSAEAVHAGATMHKTASLTWILEDVKGPWLYNGGNANADGVISTFAITASTTQTQGQGALTVDRNYVSTVANVNDTCTLPAAVAGKKVYVKNNGANTLQLFPASGASINGGSTDASVTIAAGSSLLLEAVSTTAWYS